MRNILSPLAAVTALALLTGCATVTRPPAIVAPEIRDWRSIATSDDQGRLRDWRDAFVTGLKMANAAGHGADVAREGRLLQPDAAIPGTIPNGNYRCRVIKLGAKSDGLLNYIAYPYFRCRIQQEGDVQGFAKLTGSQRQVGLIFPHDQLRQVFLGTLVLGDEARAMQYGSDPERDLVGYVERFDTARWRLLLPSPRFESQIDVMELVPA